MEENLAGILVLDIGVQPPQSIYLWKVTKVVVHLDPHMISPEQMTTRRWRHVPENLYDFV